MPTNHDLNSNHDDQTNIQPSNGFVFRKKWLLTNRVPAFFELFKKQEGLNLNQDQVFEIILQADPSKNKSAVQWIVECYCREGFLWEDIQGGATSKVKETLELFGKYKKNLPVNKRNIYGYKTLGNLYTSVQNYHLIELEQAENSDYNRLENFNRLVLKGRTLKLWEKQKALENTYTLSDQKDLKIVIPLTQEAAQWWGKGTRWCTSAKDNNMFGYYNKHAPLFILLFEDDKKRQRRLQLWITNDQIQWMDEGDNKVDKNLFEHDWDRFELLFKYLLTVNPDILAFVPEPFLTYTQCKQALEQNGLSLQMVPKKFHNLELYTIACQQAGGALYYVPQRLRKQSLCEQAVKQTGMALEYVPESLRTLELYQQAVKTYGFSLSFVPEGLKTYEMCKTAVQSQGNSLEFVPEHMIDEELCSIAVQNNSLSLCFVPKHFLTFEICQMAVKKCGQALLYVPKEFISYTMCEQMLKNDGEGLFHIPKNLLDYNLCKLAVEQNIHALLDVPDQFKNLELCQKAVEKDVIAYVFVPKEIRTDEFENFYQRSLAKQNLNHNWKLEQVIEHFDQIKKQNTNDNTNDNNYKISLFDNK